MTNIEPNFQPNAESIELAATLKVNLSLAHIQEFIAFWTRKAAKREDWQKEFQNQIRFLQRKREMGAKGAQGQDHDLRAWAEKVLAQPWRFNADANRVAHEMFPDIESIRDPRPLDAETTIGHVRHAVGYDSIGYKATARIVKTWIRKNGLKRVLDVAQEHYRKRPLRCIPWIEDELYGPLDPAQSITAILAASRPQTRYTAIHDQPGPQPPAGASDPPAEALSPPSQKQDGLQAVQNAGHQSEMPERRAANPFREEP